MYFDTKECEWSDLEVYVNGVKITKITGLKFKKTKEKELLYAGDSEPIGIQSGNKGYSGTLTVLRGALEDMNAASRAAGVDDILDAEWSLVCKFKAKGNRLMNTHSIPVAEFSEFEDGLMQNDKKGEIALPFIFTKLIST